MTLEQFNALIELLPNIEEVVQQKGGTLVRPEYKTGNGAAEDQGEEEEPNEEEIEGEVEAKEENDEEARPAEKAKKQNIEATSDEEESEEE